MTKVRDKVSIVVLSLISYTTSVSITKVLDSKCLSPTGYFADPEQCDLYYHCEEGVATPKLCPDGLLFKGVEETNVKCDYPFNVDCGAREFVQEPESHIDSRCYRANGFFNHEDEKVCSRFYNCVNGIAYELPCAESLIFDEAIGTCVREIQASKFARICVKNLNDSSIHGFSCPEEQTIGPHGQPLAHPRFPHPKNCQSFITCYFGKDIRELACGEGEVFDDKTGKCTLAEDGPQDCLCWYQCLPSSDCPSTCRSDCSCS